MRATGFQRRFTPLALAALAAALFAAPACAARPKSIDDNVIVAGKRAGKVYLGMPLSELITAMGAPTQQAPYPDALESTYGFPGVAVAADQKVYWIVASGPRFRTAEGVGPGVSLIEARARLGAPKCAITKGDETTYDYPGLYLVVNNKTGFVDRVGVRRSVKNCED